MKNKLDGFLLIEVVVSLFITCLSIIFISLILGCVKSVNKKVQKQSTNDYHLSIIQRDIYLGENAMLTSISQEQLKIANTSKNSAIFLEKYKNMIRVRGEAGGHMPLLINIEELKYEQENNETVKEKVKIHGKNYENFLFFNKAPKSR